MAVVARAVQDDDPQVAVVETFHNPRAVSSGGSKTTTMMNLAGVCAENSRVLVIDVDPQGSSAWWADRAGDSLPFDVADDTDPRNLARLRELPYDVVFVDTPGSFEGRDVLSTVLGESDFVILPTEPLPLAFAPLMATINEVVVPAGVNYRVLVNRVDPRVPSDLVDAQGLLDGAGFARFEAAIRSSPSCSAIQSRKLHSQLVTRLFRLNLNRRYYQYPRLLLKLHGRPVQ